MLQWLPRAVSPLSICTAPQMVICFVDGPSIRSPPLRRIFLPSVCKPHHGRRCLQGAILEEKCPLPGDLLGSLSLHISVSEGTRSPGPLTYLPCPRIGQVGSLNISTAGRCPLRISSRQYIGASMPNPAAASPFSSGRTPNVGPFPLPLSVVCMNKSPLRESVQRLRRRNAGDGSPRVHGTPQGGPECPTGRGPRVAFLELLRLLKEDKLRVTGVILALLLSSGTQLLLPLAVGKLVDAAAQSPLEQQQHQSAQQAQLGRGDWLRGQEGPTSSSCCSAEAENVMPAVKGAARPEATTIPGPERAAAISTEAAGEHSIWGRLVGAIEERVQTPGARLGLCVALGAVGAITSFTRLFLLESTIERVACRLRGSLFRRLLYQTLPNSQQQQLGALMKHLSQDVVTASRVLVDISFGLRCLLTSVVGIALCWAAAPCSFLLSLLLPVACVAGLFRLSARHVARLQQQHSKALQGALQRATGALSSRGQLRSLNGEALEAKAFGDALEDVLAAAQRTSVAVGCRHAFVFAAGSGLLIHLVNAAASLVAQGVLTGGQVMSLALYSAFVGSSIQGCATAWSDAYRAAAAADDMLRQLLRPLPPLLASPLDYPSELRRFQAALRQQHQLAKQEQDQEVASTLTAATDHRCPAVEFRDVWFSYPLREGQWALRGLSFKVPPGAVVAVTGPSGSGKSSLGALLLRLFEPQRGGIFFEGLPIHAYDERFIRALVIPVLQDSLLLSGMTLEDQIRYGYMAQQEALGTTPDVHSPVSASCDAACVSKFAATLPEGLQTRLCGSGAVLSGGQKQRVCLAMAFCRLEHSQRDRQKTKLPTVLFMDEATSSLDADTESQVLKNLKRKLHGETCLFVSHRPGVLEIADHIMVLVDGKVAQFGPKGEVLRKPCPPLQWLISGAVPCGHVST